MIARVFRIGAVSLGVLALVLLAMGNETRTVTTVAVLALVFATLGGSFTPLRDVRLDAILREASTVTERLRMHLDAFENGLSGFDRLDREEERHRG